MQCFVVIINDDIQRERYRISRDIIGELRGIIPWRNNNKKRMTMKLCWTTHPLFLTGKNVEADDIFVIITPQKCNMSAAVSATSGRLPLPAKISE